MEDSEWKILDLGNTPISYETARTVILAPDNADKVFREVPYIKPTGGKAYIFKSSFALSKLHPKFDPYKFMFMGKGYNKEFDVMKRYYHLKHSRTDLDKQLYNFQRHIYSLTLEETNGLMNYYLVHYFGNDYLLEAAQYRRGAPTVAEHGNGIILQNTSYDEVVNDSQEGLSLSDDDEPPSLISCFPEESVEVSRNDTPVLPVISSTRKRKSVSIQPYKHEVTPAVEKNVTVQIDIGQQQTQEVSNVDYLFAMNIAAQLQQLPREMKARVKFQIATVFYEAEMKAMNCSRDDLMTDG